MDTQKILEFLPLAAAVAIAVLVPILELPFRRFAFPFASATLGCLAAKPLTTWIMRSFELEGRKPHTLILFQSATVLAIVAIAVGERLRGAKIAWRPLVASLGIMSVPMTMLASRVLNGYGPRVYDLGEAGAWVSAAGYVVGPSAIAALVYLLGVHRRELEEELGR